MINENPKSGKTKHILLKTPLSKDSDKEFYNLKNYDNGGNTDKKRPTCKILNCLIRRHSKHPKQQEKKADYNMGKGEPIRNI